MTSMTAKEYFIKLKIMYITLLIILTLHRIVAILEISYNKQHNTEVQFTGLLKICHQNSTYMSAITPNTIME